MPLPPSQIIAKCIDAINYVTKKLWKGGFEELRWRNGIGQSKLGSRGVLLCSNEASPIMKRMSATRLSTLPRALSSAVRATFRYTGAQGVGIMHETR